MFGATKLYPWFVHTLGFHGTFWMYSIVMLIEVCTSSDQIVNYIKRDYLQVVYAAISIPENKGESLVRTEEKMAGQKPDQLIVKRRERLLNPLVARA